MMNLKIKNNISGLFWLYISFIIGGLLGLFIPGVIFNYPLLSEIGVVFFSLGIVEALSEWSRRKEKNLLNESKKLGLLRINYEEKINKLFKKKLKDAKFSIYLIGFNLNSLLENLTEDFKDIIMKNKSKKRFTLRFFTTREYDEPFNHEQEKPGTTGLYENAKARFDQLKNYAIENNFQGIISLLAYRDIPYCSLIIIDNRWAFWTPYLYSLSSADNIRFVFKSRSNSENQFQYFERHYDFLSNPENNWTKLIDTNREIKNEL